MTNSKLASQEMLVAVNQALEHLGSAMRSDDDIIDLDEHCKLREALRKTAKHYIDLGHHTSDQLIKSLHHGARQLCQDQLKRIHKAFLHMKECLEPTRPPTAATPHASVRQGQNTFATA